MRVYFRAFEPEDYKLVSEWRNDEEITRLLGGNNFFVSTERDKQWVLNKSIDDNREIYLAVCLLEDKRMIGYTSINNIDLRNLKVEWGGTIIGDKKLWGQGYASEAARLMLSHIFHQYPIHKCYAFCLQEHHITEKMFLSLGFILDGVLRDEVFKNGEYKSVLVYSILRSEYELSLLKDQT